MKTIYTGGKLLLRDEKGHYEAVKCNLGIVGKYISYIGTDCPAEYERRDVSGCILMPGMVNAHGHAAMTLLRGAGDGLPLDEWLSKAIFPVEDRMNDEIIAAGTGMAILEMLASGTTLYSDMYDYPWAAAKTALSMKMKANVSRVGFCPDFVPADFAEKRLSEIEMLTEAQSSDTDLVRWEYSIHAEYTTNEQFLSALRSKMDRHPDFCVNMHVSETKKEHDECIMRCGKTPAAYFESLGIFNNPVYAAHCVHVSDDDLEIFKRHNASVVYCPSSNLKLGSGFAPVGKMLGMGINVALGTDGCASNNNLNMFEEMHIAALAGSALPGPGCSISCDSLIDMATVSGARALGRPDTGILKEGMKADFIALDFDKPHLSGRCGVPSLLVYSAQGSDVCMTVVNGNVLYERGSYPQFDEQEIKRRFNKALDDLYS